MGDRWSDWAKNDQKSTEASKVQEAKAHIYCVRQWI